MLDKIRKKAAIFSLAAALTSCSPTAKEDIRPPIVQKVEDTSVYWKLFPKEDVVDDVKVFVDGDKLHLIDARGSIRSFTVEGIKGKPILSADPNYVYVAFEGSGEAVIVRRSDGETWRHRFKKILKGTAVAGFNGTMVIVHRGGVIILPQDKGALKIEGDRRFTNLKNPAVDMTKDGIYLTAAGLRKVYLVKLDGSVFSANIDDVIKEIGPLKRPRLMVKGDEIFLRNDNSPIISLKNGRIHRILKVE